MIGGTKFKAKPGNQQAMSRCWYSPSKTVRTQRHGEKKAFVNSNLYSKRMVHRERLRRKIYRQNCQCDSSRENSNISKRSSDGTKEVVYSDSWSDIAFIALCRIAYGNISGWQSSRSWTNGDETFKGMVEVSRALMRNRSGREQRNAVISGFPEIPDWFRKLFPYSKWGAEVNAWLTLRFFQWLVGPMKIVEVEVDRSNDGESGKIQQMSGVQIERCRYLAESNCTSMCVNLCKSPCQTFFTEELGMPLYMEPNFGDKSCLMVFGQNPPPLEEDPALKQSCLEGCATYVTGETCHKLVDTS